MLVDDQTRAYLFRIGRRAIGRRSRVRRPITAPLSPVTALLWVGLPRFTLFRTPSFAIRPHSTRSDAVHHTLVDHFDGHDESRFNRHAVLKRKCTYKTPIARTLLRGRYGSDTRISGGGKIKRNSAWATVVRITSGFHDFFNDQKTPWRKKIFVSLTVRVSGPEKAAYFHTRGSRFRHVSTVRAKRFSVLSGGACFFSPLLSHVRPPRRRRTNNKTRRGERVCRRSDPFFRGEGQGRRQREIPATGRLSGTPAAAGTMSVGGGGRRRSGKGIIGISTALLPVRRPKTDVDGPGVLRAAVGGAGPSGPRDAAAERVVRPVDSRLAAFNPTPAVRADHLFDADLVSRPV